MFSNTKERLTSMLENMKKIYRFFRYALIFFTTIYFIYALISHTGVFVINLILAILFVGYSIFEIVSYRRQSKRVRKIVKKSYNWTKLALKALSLSIMIYGLYSATTKPSTLSIVIIGLTTLLWIVQLILEVILSISEKQIDKMVTSVKGDINNVKESFSKSKEKITNTINQLKEKMIEKKEENDEIVITDNEDIITIDNDSNLENNLDN